MASVMQANTDFALQIESEVAGKAKVAVPAASQMRSLSGTMTHEVVFFAFVTNIEVKQQVVLRYRGLSYQRLRRVPRMKELMNIDLRDLANMLGLASLSAAVTSIGFDTVLGYNPPQAVALLAAAAGFVAGRFVSANLRSVKHV